MRDFVASTWLWSDYYLNDPPMSRRPWLHRPKSWEAIDSALSADPQHTRFAQRKHAEEYLRNHRGFSESTVPLRGMWGCPLRNAEFVGRESQLSELQSLLQQDGMVQICGLGGMGKSSLANEYVQRMFSQHRYELVVFLHAETRTALASDLRKFAKEMLQVHHRHSLPGAAVLVASGRPQHVNTFASHEVDKNGATDDDGNDTDEEFVAADFRRHISNCQSSFVVIFDNLENTSWLSNYLPGAGEGSISGTGSGSISRVGHVIVTSRVARDLSNAMSLRGLQAKQCRTLQLDSLSPTESLQFLQHALGEDESDSVGAPTSAVGSSSDASPPPQGGRLSRRSFSGTSAAAAAISRLRCFSELGERLGHLPLALSMAYMKRCDVSARDYLERLNDADREREESDLLAASSGLSSPSSSDSLQTMGAVSFFSPDSAITASVSMALDRIALECASATSVLYRLAFLGPDGISKNLVLQLVLTGHLRAQGPQE